MKTFGLKSLYLQLIIIVLIVGFWVFAPKTWGARQALIIPFALLISQLVYTPVIRLSGNRFRVFTLTPFQKNINLEFTEAHKIILEINNSMRIVAHKTDGTILSVTSSRYAYDMKPLYYALKDTGVVIESHGVGAIDWV